MNTPPGTHGRLAPRSRGPFAVTLAGLLIHTFGPAGFSQSPLRRGAPIQHVTEVSEGDLLIGAGAAYEANLRVPLVAVVGDLARIGILELVYGVADGVVITVRGDAYRLLSVDSFGPVLVDAAGDTLVRRDEGLLDGTSGGAGDFRAGVMFRAFGDGEGLSVGGRLEFNIPDSNQSEGLGTNTTNIRVSGIVSYGRGSLRVTGDLGVAILEAPLENFEQNDVIAYSAEALCVPSSRVPLRLFAALDGRASTRDRIPVGTEDVGRILFGADYRLGSWLVDAAAAVGYAGVSPDYGVGGGVAFLF